MDFNLKNPYSETGAHWIKAKTAFKGLMAYPFLWKRIRVE